MTLYDVDALQTENASLKEELARLRQRETALETEIARLQNLVRFYTDSIENRSSNEP